LKYTRGPVSFRKAIHFEITTPTKIKYNTTGVRVKMALSTVIPPHANTYDGNNAIPRNPRTVTFDFIVEK
jgi:hypothetical protein